MLASRTSPSPSGRSTSRRWTAWLRNSPGFDGVIDFDKVVRDPAAPTKLRAEYDSGDHIHMNDAGYQAMANSIPLQLVR